MQNNVNKQDWLVMFKEIGLNDETIKYLASYI